jgi:lipopolysaccharide export system permease protein
VSILDRYIFLRFGANFALLFSLLFVFAVSIDLIFNLDRFVDAAAQLTGPDGGVLRFTGTLLTLVGNFQGPRLFQFYAYLHGLVAIGAMGFTLSQMHRYRELVAIMASGVSLHRVAMPFIVAVFALSMIQMVNQELMLPRVAPLLLRGTHNVGEQGIDQYEVLFTPDGNGNLLAAPSFDPQAKTLSWLTVLERDDRGRTVRRVTADRATWSESDQHWLLTNGQAVQPGGASEAGGQMIAKPIASYQTDLTPQALLVRRYNQFATMLSLDQISQMLKSPRIAERDVLLRYYYSRFSSVLVNLLVLALSLPFFLLREPANLLRQSVLCAAISIPATMGAAIGMMLDLPGIPPAAGVFLPVIALLFLAVFPWTFFKT